MRRIVLSLAVLVSLTFLAAAGVLYLARDQILLREVRLQAQRMHPVYVEVGSLHTQLFGTVALELGSLEVRQSNGANLKIPSVRIESPLGLTGLWKAWQSREEIPLRILVSNPRLVLPPAPPAAKSEPRSAWPSQVPLPALNPAPVALELNVTGGEVSGSARGKDLRLQLSARIRETGMEANADLSLSAGTAESEVLLPIGLKARLVASRKALKVQSLTIRAASLEGSGSGELGLQPVQGSFRIGLNAPDLSRLNLRPEDRTALGLTAQPSGAVTLEAEGKVSGEGQINANGQLRLESLVLPLRAPERTAFASLGKGHHVDGTVQAQALIPFRLAAAWPFTAAPSSAIQNGSFAFDLTQASLVSQGILEKKRDVPLRGELTFSSTQAGLEISRFSLNFHKLTASGDASLPVPLGSSIGAGFSVRVASLSGFPELLPMLREENQGAKLAEAKGEIQAEGRVRFLPGAAGKSLIDLRNLSVKELQLPLAYASESLSLRGVLAGNASGAGKFSSGDLNVTRSNGTFDLTRLELAIPGKFAKKRGRKLQLAFDANGTPTRLQISRVSLAAEGLSASLAGTAAFDSQRNATLNLNSTARAELGPLREYLPKLPAKISAGTFEASLRVGGRWLPEGGIEKSPLLISGKASAKLGQVEMADAPADGQAPAKPAAPAALLPPWPAAQNASIQFRADVTEFRRGTLTASGISAAGSLEKGKLRVASAGIARVFGGRVKIGNFAADLTKPRLELGGAAEAEGLELSSMAAFVDPSYGKIVKGSLKASSQFLVPDFWSDKLLESVSATGQADVKNGYLSTATLDGLVNEKLKGIPGVGDKAKVSTGGVATDVHTDYRFENGELSFQQFLATTPKNDEMRLKGTLSLTFDADLSGEAHLANAPVSGAFREANSDPQGRLVVPVRFHGNLKSPSAEIANSAIETMTKNLALHEGEKLKARALEEAKKKAQSAVQDAAGGLLDQFKKSLKR